MARSTIRSVGIFLRLGVIALMVVAVIAAEARPRELPTATALFQDSTAGGPLLVRLARSVLPAQDPAARAN